MDHKRLFPTAGELLETDKLLPLGQAARVRPGSAVTIATYSYMTSVVLEAADRLAAEGISAEVIDLRTLAPLDLETVCDSVARTGALLTVEEGQVVCGVGAEIAFRVREQLPQARLARLGARRAPISSNPVFEAYCLPSPDRVREAVHALLRNSPQRRTEDAGTPPE